MADHGEDLPHYRPCDEALTLVGEESGATGSPVDLGRSKHQLIAVLVPGIGWECFKNWLDYEAEFERHITRYGFSSFLLNVDGMSGSTHNAKQIRDAIMERADSLQPEQLVLVGYSKGAPDLLEAVSEGSLWQRLGLGLRIAFYQRRLRRGAMLQAA